MTSRCGLRPVPDAKRTTLRSAVASIHNTFWVALLTSLSMVFLLILSLSLLAKSALEVLVNTTILRTLTVGRTKLRDGAGNFSYYAAAETRVVSDIERR